MKVTFLTINEEIMAFGKKKNSFFGERILNLSKGNNLEEDKYCSQEGVHWDGSDIKKQYRKSPVMRIVNVCPVRHLGLPHV